MEVLIVAKSIFLWSWILCIWVKSKIGVALLSFLAILYSLRRALIFLVFLLILFYWLMILNIIIFIWIAFFILQLICTILILLKAFFKVILIQFLLISESVSLNKFFYFTFYFLFIQIELRIAFTISKILNIPLRRIMLDFRFFYFLKLLDSLLIDS